MCKTKDIKRVLVPLQFDKAGKKLLRYAGHLAHTLGAELILLQNSHTAELTYTQQNLALQRLRNFVMRILGGEQQSIHQVPFQCVVRPGQLHECVTAMLEEYAANMVLMETCVLHHEEGHSDPNNAAAIMELVRCPVMVVPCTATFKKLENLVFATDFTDQEDHVQQQIADFAAQAAAKLTLVQVYSRAERPKLLAYKTAMQRVENKLGGRNVTLKLLEEEDTLEGIGDFAESAAANMLILATQDSHLMQRLFSSNYIKTMAYHTRYPILTFRQQKKKPCSGCCTNCQNKAEAKQTVMATA